MTVGYKQPEVPWNGLTVTDLFCGAGGSSSGLVEAGYRVVIAANHWALAIKSHQVNHPETDHSQADISQVDPAYFPRTHVLWGSPECTNHSIAKGVKRQRQQDLALFELDGTPPLADEAANRSRATMWDIPRFAEHHRYMAIILENVVDAARWDQFPAWQHAMEAIGYELQFVWLNSMHAQIGGLPAPQSRDRMYIVMHRADLATKKNPKPNVAKWTAPMALCLEHGEIQAVQAFKKAERWGRYRAQYLYRCPKCWQVVEPGWLAADSIIDWSIPAPRIGDRPLKEFWADKKKTQSLGFHHLAPKTLDRGRRGIERYWTPLVVEAAGNAYDSTDPRHPAHGRDDGYIRAWPVDEPLRTLHTTASKGVMIPPLIVNNVSGADGARSRPVSEVLPSIVAGGTHAALLVPVEGREGKSAAPATSPLRTQSTRNETGVLVPLVVPMRNHGVAKPVTEPIDTVSAEGNHHALIMRNNEGGAEMSTPVAEPLRTLTTTGHQALVTPSEPISLDILDAGFRMLEPHEIKRGMGFAEDYLLLGTKRDMVKQAGNAVTPPAARDLGHAVAEFLLAVAA